MTTSDSRFRPIERLLTPHRIVEQFQHMITTKRLAPGDRLPPERELAHVLGVGRSTLREAMRALESMEIVETRAGQGTFLRVADLPLTIIARPVASCAAFRTILEARRAVEPTIAALAAARATPAALHRLQQALADEATQIEQGENWTTGDLAFHAELSRAAENEVLHHFLESLEVVLRAGREAVERPGGGRPRQSQQEHQDILGAVAARNPPEAERRMVAHLEAVRAWAAGLPCWCGGCATPTG
jgi:GntR family transcriptional regulator, transcriptional repressor for pyruvate dehydrogenase complex